MSSNNNIINSHLACGHCADAHPFLECPIFHKTLEILTHCWPLPCLGPLSVPTIISRFKHIWLDITCNFLFFTKIFIEILVVFHPIFFQPVESSRSIHMLFIEVNFGEEKFWSSRLAKVTQTGFYHLLLFGNFFTKVSHDIKLVFF